MIRNLVIFMIVSAAMICAESKLRVVASIPDLGDMARRIGGDRVEVIVLSTGREDLHAVPARPSFLPKLNRADLLLSLGLDAEHAWLPALCAEARNPRIREDAEGWVETWKGVELLEVPVRLDRSEGEQHPEGNPHYNIGPQCGAIMAGNIAEAFAALLPENSSDFQKNLAAYQAALDILVRELAEKGALLRNVKVIDYHPDNPYLCAFYGMQPVGSIEPKAGIAPTAGHLRVLTEAGRKAGVRLIIYNQSQNGKVPEQVARALGCRAVRIANAVGAEKSIVSWADLQRHNLDVLLLGLSGKGQP